MAGSLKLHGLLEYALTIYSEAASVNIESVCPT